MTLFDAADYDNVVDPPPPVPGSTVGHDATLLDTLFASGSIGAAARRFALEIAGAESEHIQALAALAVQAVVDGNSCVMLDGLGSRLDAQLEAAGVDAAVRSTFEPEAGWVAAAATSDLVAAESTTEEIASLHARRPLVLDNDRLFLRRFWLDELTIAQRLTQVGDPIDLTVDAELLDQLFPITERDPENRPLLAGRKALESRLTILTGGPGTGKTWTLARTISALWASNPELDVALAAPTGKAAMRMREALSESVAGLSDTDTTRRVREIEPSTLHRLLGLRPGRQPRRHAHNQLPHDVVIVDEASMISLPLMADLLRAIRSDARLILVGDPRQLASVEAGAVLDDLVQAPALALCVAELHVNHRSIEAFDELFAAVNHGDGDRAIELLRSDSSAVNWIDTSGAASIGETIEMTADVLDTELAPHANALVDAAQAKDFDRDHSAQLLDQVKVLCATRSGPLGVDTWARRVETKLFRRVRPEQWYVGRPLLVTENNYITGLLNGDTGLCLGDRAWFPGAGEFATQQLGEISTWWAMTIHKSQGSEFDHAIVSLGDETRIHTRELLYTALTRARTRLTIIASEEVLQSTIARRSRRSSGLDTKLAESSR